MWNKPSKEELAALPPLYSTENISLRDKIIHMHFFIGGCDWYAAEYSEEEALFFGFAILNGDLANAEWGYFSLYELCSLKLSFLEADRDMFWKARKAVEVKAIRKAQRWQAPDEDNAAQTKNTEEVIHHEPK